MATWKVNVGNKVLAIHDKKDQLTFIEAATRALEFLYQSNTAYQIGPTLTVTNTTTKKAVTCASTLILANAGRYNEATQLTELLKKETGNKSEGN